MYGDANDNAIMAQWINLQIAYTQSKQRNDNVVVLADQLFKSLVNRDQTQRDKDFTPIKIIGEDHDEGIDQVKILCIVTHILEMTRLQKPENK